MTSLRATVTRCSDRRWTTTTTSPVASTPCRTGTSGDPCPGDAGGDVGTDGTPVPVARTRTPDLNVGYGSGGRNRHVVAVADGAVVQVPEVASNVAVGTAAGVGGGNRGAGSDLCEAMLRTAGEEVAAAAAVAAVRSFPRFCFEQERSWLFFKQRTLSSGLPCASDN